MTILLTLGLQVVVHLSTAVDNLTDLRISNELRVLVLNDFVESESRAEVFEVRVATSEFQ